VLKLGWVGRFFHGCVWLGLQAFTGGQLATYPIF
jgi:cytosine/uracil/thiamine/allantoin permease